MVDKSHWLIQNLNNFDDQLALVFNNQEYTYKQILRQVSIYDNETIKKIPPNAVVSIVSDYSFYSISIFLTLLNKRCIIVPITSSIIEEQDLRIAESKSELVITFDENNSLSIHEVNQTRPSHDLIDDLKLEDCPGLILFSSGSTGKPKAMLQNLENLCLAHKNKKPKSLVMMIFLMFDHIGGINTLLGSLMMGGVMVIPSNRDPLHVCSLIEKYKVIVLPASPTFLNLLIISDSHNKFDLSSLRMITYGTESMPESLLLKLRGIFKRVRFLQTFGTSETGITQMKSKSSESTFMKFDDSGSDYKIIDGKLFLKSNTQISGYLNASMESFDSEGWFDTGDLAEESDDGYIKIIGRSKEMINIGGEKVLPTEIESLLLEMPEIEDCTVYGEPNPIMGQSVKVKVVMNIDVSNREARKIINSYCKNKIESYKIPSSVEVVEKNDFSDRFKKTRKA
tara:strand:+ start:8750 stop:10108 length:1359 start_codon:yes stop_codon:yes gene_type:complete